MPCGIAQKYVREIYEKRRVDGPVIDLGSGNYASWYKPIFNGEEYYTLDFDKTPSFTPNFIMDIHDMRKIKNNTYGIVLILETLEHVRNPFKAFKEIHRIMRKGGLLICTTVAAWCLHREPQDFWRFLPDGLQELCDSSNLKLFDVQLQDAECKGHSHCMCAATK